MRIQTLCGRHLTPEHLVTSLSVEWCRIFDLQSKRHWQDAYSFPHRYRLPQSPIRIQTSSDNTSSLREALLPSLHLRQPGSEVFDAPVRMLLKCWTECVRQDLNYPPTSVGGI